MIVTSVTFNSEWMIALFTDGGGWMIAIPINNPEKKQPTLNLTSKQYYNNGNWNNIETASIRHYNESMVFIYMSGITSANNVTALVSFVGTLTI
jgi:hypothetical protein